MTAYFRCDTFGKPFSSHIVVLLLAMLTFPYILSAQTTSTIEGTVTDKQGLAVAEAEVHAEGSAAAAGARRRSSSKEVKST